MRRYMTLALCLFLTPLLFPAAPAAGVSTICDIVDVTLLEPADAPDDESGYETYDDGIKVWVVTNESTGEGAMVSFSTYCLVSTAECILDQLLEVRMGEDRVLPSVLLRLDRGMFDDSGLGEVYDVLLEASDDERHSADEVVHHIKSRCLEDHAAYVVKPYT